MKADKTTIRRSGFDRVARIYRLMELLTFGSHLHHARIAHLNEIKNSKEVLLAGEGNGRFLQALLATNKSCRATCVDWSAEMLKQARSRTRKEDLDRVCFKQADLARAKLKTNQFDTIVTHYFLDCFRRETLEGLVPMLASALKPKGKWLLADFWKPENLKPSYAQDTCLKLLYGFFKVFCGIEASRLHDPTDILMSTGMGRTKSNQFCNGWINSSVYQKTG